LAKEFQRADPAKPSHRLFTGHIGVGKSTELLRLKSLLENPADGAPRSEVIYFDVNEYLDPNDLKLADLLVLVAARVLDHLRGLRVPGFTATNQALTRFWDDMAQVLKSEINLTEVSFEAGFTRLTTEIKQGAPNARQRLREAINRQRTTLRAGVNDLLQMAGKALRDAQQGQSLVVIVDGLEKLPADQHKELFFEACEQLADLAAHSVYTVPMSLAYDPRFTTITQAFGHTPLPVPMLHVDKEGVDCLKSLIAKRSGVAGVDADTVFDSEATRDHLCKQTGGHLRHLMMFLQSALNKVDALPITKKAVDSALQDYRHALARQIPGSYWPWLRRFREGPLQALPDDLPEDIRRDMLHQLLVYEYANGEPRYNVNPVIRGLYNFTHGQPAGQPAQP
jgi:hypothetical protein